MNNTNTNTNSNAKRFAPSGVRVEDVLGRSFLENARALRRPLARHLLVTTIIVQLLVLWLYPQCYNHTYYY